MDPASIHTIPRETLHLIFTFIDHKPSLRSLSLVNKEIHSITAEFLFRELTINIKTELELAKDLRLLPVTALQHVQQLHINDAMLERLWRYRVRAIQRQDGPELPHWIEQHNFTPESFYQWEIRERYARKIDYSDPHLPDNAWVPLANLLRHLPRLKDVYYNCLSQLAPCVLESLHSHQRRCRLHINPFCLQSLDGVKYPGVDSQELALATSPCLYSISAGHTITYPLSEPDYNRNAIRNIAAGMAPNLKELSVFQKGVWHSLLQIGNVGSQHGLNVDGAIKGLTQELTKVPKRSQLTRLALYEGNNEGIILPCPKITEEILAWSEIIDVSTLRILHLDCSIDSDMLYSMTTNFCFGSLQNLLFRIKNVDTPNKTSDTEYNDAASSFLCSLPRLKILNLKGEFSLTTCFAALRYHGEQLQVLHLLQTSRAKQVVFKLQEILDIKTLCPQLNELSIKIPRSRGDANEVAIYKALGSFPKLDTLHLTLDCSNYFPVTIADDGTANEEIVLPNDPSFDELDQQIISRPIPYPGPTGPNGAELYLDIRRGHVRDALINSALDGVLARAIFSAVSSGKPPGALLLETLAVTTAGGCRFRDNDWGTSSRFKNLVRKISQSWFVERNVRDDCRHQFVETRLRSGDREFSTTWGKMFVVGKEIFQRIWPPSQGGGSQEGRPWHDDWHSFPLQEV
jgi:hypothetical protein